MMVSSWESPVEAKIRFADQPHHYHHRHHQSYQHIHCYHHHPHHLSLEHSYTFHDGVSYFASLQNHISLTNIFLSISSDHISLYVGWTGGVYFSLRKFINIVVSLMVRLKRRKWILAIYKVLFKQLVIQPPSNIYQPVMNKAMTMMNKSTLKHKVYEFPQGEIYPAGPTNVQGNMVTGY
jgi:hypothetical protein